MILRKNGELDRRYKVNRYLKKDGSPDRRYKVNRWLKSDGTPDQRTLPVKIAEAEGLKPGSLEAKNVNAVINDEKGSFTVSVYNEHVRSALMQWDANLNFKTYKIKIQGEVYDIDADELFMLLDEIEEKAGESYVRYRLRRRTGDKSQTIDFDKSFITGGDYDDYHVQFFKDIINFGNDGEGYI